MIRKSFPLALTSSFQTIYTVPVNKKAELVLVFVSNTSGSNGNFDLQIYNAATSATLSAFSGYTVTSKEYFEIGGQPNQFVALSAGDYLQLKSTVDMTAIVSIVESNALVTGG